MVKGMARVTCRRRPDGITEIVPPAAWQRFASDFRSAFIAVGVIVATVVSSVLHTLIGVVPTLVALGCAAAGAVLWRRDRTARRPATPGAAHRRASAQ
jgi:hypothetical protein